MQTQTHSGMTTKQRTWDRHGTQLVMTWKLHLKRLRTVQPSLVCKRTWTGWHEIACRAGWIKGQIKFHVSADWLLFLAQDLRLSLHQEVCTKDVCLAFWRSQVKIKCGHRVVSIKESHKSMRFKSTTWFNVSQRYPWTELQLFDDSLCGFRRRPWGWLYTSALYVR